MELGHQDLALMVTHCAKAEIDPLTPKSGQWLLLEGRVANSKAPSNQVTFYSLSEWGTGEFVTLSMILNSQCIQNFT